MYKNTRSVPGLPAAIAAPAAPTSPSAPALVRRGLACALSLLLALAAAGGLAGCAARSAAPAPGGSAAGSAAGSDTGSVAAADVPDELGPAEVEVVFWHIQAGVYGEAVKEIVAAFNREHAGRIRVREVFQGNYGDLNKKLRAAIQGGGLPAVAMAYENEILEYERAGTVVPLDSYISHPRWGLSETERQDFMPAVLARQQLPVYGGRTLSWPHGNSAQGLYYNRDLLSRAGFHAPAATWADFFTQLQAIRERTGVPGLVLSGSGLGGSFMGWLRTYGGGEPIRSDGTAALDTPAAVALLGQLKNAIDSGAARRAQDPEQEFTNGRAAFEIGSTARTASKIELIGDNFAWGVSLIPQGGSGPASTQLYGGNHVLLRSDPQTQLAGWLFLKYFAGPAAQAQYAAGTGYFPATRSAQSAEVLKADYARHPEKAQAFQEVFPHAAILPPHAGTNAVRQELDRVIDEVLAGKLTPEQGAKKMQANATRALAESGR